jgi:hypothetical protein
MLIVLDTLIARASGLPPLLELGSWDVKGISELKEHLIGVPNGMKHPFQEVRAK